MTSSVLLPLYHITIIRQTSVAIYTINVTLYRFHLIARPLQMRSIHSPPPDRIYSIAECTLPPVASNARTFCVAFTKPMSCSCYMSMTTVSEKSNPQTEGNEPGVVLETAPPGVCCQQVEEV